MPEKRSIPERVEELPELITVQWNDARSCYYLPEYADQFCFWLSHPERSEKPDPEKTPGMGLWTWAELSPNGRAPYYRLYMPFAFTKATTYEKIVSQEPRDSDIVLDWLALELQRQRQ